MKTVLIAICLSLVLAPLASAELVEGHFSLSATETVLREFEEDDNPDISKLPLDPSSKSGESVKQP